PVIVRKLDATTSEAVREYHSYLTALQLPDSMRSSAGYNVPPSGFNTIARDLEIFEAHLQQDIESNAHESLTGATLTLQFLLLAGLPVLIALPRRFRNTKAKLVALNREIDESNRKYVFDPLDDIDVENEQEIRSRLLANLRQAAEFIQQVSQGNYDVRWEGMNDRNREANRENIAGELIQMREQMKKVKQEDEIRMWMTEGLSNFGTIIQKNQDNLQSLGDVFISGLVKYLNAK